MGIAGFAMLASIVFFVKSLVALFKYLKWKDKEAVTGTIGDLIRKQYDEEYDKTAVYVYSFLLHTSSGSVNSQFVERVDPKTPPERKSGDTIDVLYDEKTEKYCVVEPLKKDLKTYPIYFAVCLVILFLCFLVFSSLNH